VRLEGVLPKGSSTREKIFWKRLEKKAGRFSFPIHSAPEEAIRPKNLFYEEKAQEKGG